MLRGAVTDLVFETPVDVTATRLGSHGPVIFTAAFNALSEMHRSRSDYGSERAYGGVDNWLHPDDVTGDHYPLLTRVHEHISALEPSLYDIAYDAFGAVSLDDIQAAKLELCVDLAAADPHFAMRRLAPAFKRQFQRVRFVRYRSSALGYGELHHDANLIRGYRGVGEQYKLYEKTNQRIRLECELDRQALFRITRSQRSHVTPDCAHGERISRSIANEGDFIALVQHLTEAVLPELNALLQADVSGADEHGSVFELIARVASLVRRDGAVVLQSILQTLGREGRLTSRSLSWAALNRLCRANVLERRTRGVYVPTARYRAALRILRFADNRWQGT